MKKSILTSGLVVGFLLFWIGRNSHSPFEAVLLRFQLEDKAKDPEVILVAEQIVLLNSAMVGLFKEENPEVFDKCRRILTLPPSTPGEDKRLAAMKRHLVLLLVDLNYAEKEYVFPFETHARDQLLHGLRDFFPVDPQDWDRAPLWVTANPRYVEVLRAKKNRLWPRENYEVRSLAD